MTIYGSFEDAMNRTNPIGMVPMNHPIINETN